MAKQGLTLPQQFVRRLVKAVRWVEAQGRDLSGKPRRRRGRGRRAVKFGKPAAAFSSGTTIELVPCDVDGADLVDRDNVTVHLAPDAASVTASYETDDVLRYLPYAKPDASDVAGVLLGLLEGAGGDAEELTGYTDLPAHYVKFEISAATEEVTINETIDFRGKLVTAWGWATDAALGIEDIAWAKDQTPEGWKIAAAPAADVILLSFLGGDLDLIVDKDDGALKWTYNQRAQETHGFARVGVRSGTPDVTRPTA